MKGLLQSKIFKKNLKKWLFMYVMCMGLFTTVITYSKYISNMLDGSDSARVSKFNIALEYCSDATCNEGIKGNEVFRQNPTSEMVYYFAVNTSNLEVSADLILTINVDTHFKIKEIEKVETDNSKVNIVSKSDNEKTESIADHAIAGNKEKMIYKVTVVYDEKVVDYNKYNCKESGNGCEVIRGVEIDKETGLPKYIFMDENNKIYDILTVGYSATQTR